MADHTHIEWTDATFNPWEGCQSVSPACDHCYAEARNARFHGGTAPNWGPGAPRRRTSASNWRKPLKWNREAEAFAAKHGRRQRVFCASLADVFDNAVDPKWRADLFDLILQTPNLDWLLLTKRIGNVKSMAPDLSTWPNVWLGATICNQAEADRDIPKLLEVPAAKRFLSMEPLLGPVRLTSIPLNGDYELDALTAYTAELAVEDWRDTEEDWEESFAEEYGFRPGERSGPLHKTLDWIIVGGESGPNSRPMHPDWTRSLRDQCQAAGVPFLFKQWGGWAPVVEMDEEAIDSCYGPALSRHPDAHRTCRVRACVLHRNGSHFSGNAMFSMRAFEGGTGAMTMFEVGKKRAGRLLDGREWSEFPPDPRPADRKGDGPPAGAPQRSEGNSTEDARADARAENT